MTSPSTFGSALEWRSATRILAVRLDSIGDVVMTTPALAALHDAPGRPSVTLLTSPAGAALAPLLPMVDAVIAHRAPWVSGACFDDDDALIERLRARRFDAAVIFTVSTQSALPASLVCRMAGIPLRLAHSRENPYGLLTHWVRDEDRLGDAMRHEVRRQLDLVASVGFSAASERLQIDIGASDARAAAAALVAHGLAERQPYFVVHVGANAASRRYAPERFGRAAREVGARTGWRAVFTGSDDEAELVARALAHAGGDAVAITRDLALGTLAALIGGARLLIANNSAPMHLAAALGTPVVALYALTNPQHTPWRVPAAVLHRHVDCRHCLKSTCPRADHACLNGVAVEQVVDAAMNLAMRPRRASAAVALPSP
ncbi:glycosyltransferase family 9 protein [Caldimonas sp. KR1-144]|uniref:glycosyltransferase family 9 protein n=1 Tax=Caldimonas sp. KR1-144 TaxID=3400911 RepID=UPI003BFFDE3C